MKTIKDFVAKINRVPLPVAFLFFQLILTGRVFIEFGETQPSVFVMQLCWYSCVLMFFVISFKYLLKVKNTELSVLALGGFLLYIPMLYSVLMHHRWHLNFINPVSFRQVAFDMLTLLAVHEYDWPLFPELVMLLLSSFAAGAILTAKPLKSLLAAVVTTYSSFLCLGFSWVAVNPEHPSFSHFTSGMPDEIIYSFYYITFWALLCVAAFWNELVDFIRQIKKPAAAVVSVLGSAVIAEIVISVFWGEKFFGIDYVLMFIPLTAAAFTVLCAWKKAWKYIFPPLWVIFLSMILLIFK